MTSERASERAGEEMGVSGRGLQCHCLHNSVPAVVLLWWISDHLTILFIFFLIYDYYGIY